MAVSGNSWKLPRMPSCEWLPLVSTLPSYFAMAVLTGWLCLPPLANVLVSVSQVHDSHYNSPINQKCPHKVWKELVKYQNIGTIVDLFTVFVNIKKSKRNYLWMQLYLGISWWFYGLMMILLILCW